MAASEIVRQAWEILEPELQQQGYELVEVEFPGRTLRLFIDKEGGVNLDDCASASHLVSAVLDRTDFIDGHYMLEVSSPGIDRPVRKSVDFQRFAGERVAVVSHAPVEGLKKFQGVLRGFEDGLILVDCDGMIRKVHVENLKKAHLQR